MPRKRPPTAAGYAPQAKNPVAGQEYGRGAEQQRLEQAMPTPSQPTVPAAATTGGQPTGMQPVAAPAPSFADVLSAAQAAGADSQLLTAPTTRPSEPVTAGLSRGPGVGPQAMGMKRGSPTGDLFRRLSATLGDPYFAELADKARV